MTYVKKIHRFGLLTPSSNTVQEPEFSAAFGCKAGDPMVRAEDQRCRIW